MCVLASHSPRNCAYTRGIESELVTSKKKHAKGRELSGTESAILNRESSDSESCDSNRAMPRSLETLTGCDSESVFRDSTLLRFHSFFCFSLRNLNWRFQARDSGNRAIRDSRFCAAKAGRGRGPHSPDIFGPPETG